jgi:serine/threonine-protein kinase HipA
LSHHQHFALSRNAAAEILDEVAAWEEELKDHYRNTWPAPNWTQP